MKKKGLNKNKKGGENAPFLPKKAVRRYDKNKRPYYVNEKGKRVSFKVWRQVKTIEKENRELRKITKVKFLKQNEYPNGKELQFYFSQGTGEIKQYLFEYRYSVNIGKNVFRELGSSELFLFLKDVYIYLTDEFTINNEDENGEKYPKIFIYLIFNNNKGNIEITRFYEGENKMFYDALELFSEF